MRRTRKLAAAAVVFAVAVGATVAVAGGTAIHRTAATGAAAKPVKLKLTPSTPQLAACMQYAHLDVTVRLTTEQLGVDVFTVRARNLPPRRDFTVFLLEQAGPPFGAAEYIGDFTTNKKGNADNAFRLIVQEAFSSTLVNDQRVRVDLNQVGVWFADPKGDDFCLGGLARRVELDYLVSARPSRLRN